MQDQSATMKSLFPVAHASRNARRASPVRSSRRHRAARLLFMAAPLLLLASGGGLFVLPAVQSSRSDLITHRVHPANLQLVFTESGTLQSAVNTDIVCRVRARSRGSMVASTLKWVIEDGSAVQAGDLVAQLDDSGYEEDLKTQRMVLTRAESDWRQAEENFAIVASQCEGDIQSAKVALELAELDFQKYLKADYEQAHQDVLGRVSQAQSDVEMWRDRVAWSRRMLKKGYMTPNQVTVAGSSLANSDIALDNVREELRVLERFTKKRTVTDLEGKVAESRRCLDRVKSQALAKRLLAHVDCLAKKSIYEIEKARRAEIEQDLKNCTITAPHAGMVVHYTSEQSRYSSGSQQGVIAQGEPVREGQRLMQIPDLSHMEVWTQIHEAVLAHVHGGERVTVHVHAFPDLVLHGRVKYVSVVPSSREWWWADIKVYPAKIALDEPPVALKPGMTAEVTIEAERPLQHVLAVPAEAVLTPVKLCGLGKCYVTTPDGPQLRELTLGMNNTTMVEVKAGLEEGEEVVLNPATVIAEEKDRLAH